MENGKVILITGASRGIGRALAIRAGEEGYRIIVNFLSGEAEAQAVVEEIHTAGGFALAVRGNVSLQSDVDHLVEETIGKCGTIDGVIHNAGQGEPVELDKLTPEDFEKTLKTNLLSAFLVSQAAVPHMKQRGGRLIFMSSGAARTGGKISAAYAASKAGMEGLMHYYATYLLPWKITANALAPSLIESEMTAQMELSDLSKLPLGRLGKPHELWPAVRMMLETEYLNGQTVHVDAGRYMT